MAVVLSTMVIIFDLLRDEYIELENKQIKTEQLTKSEKPSAPSIVKKAEIKVSRSDAITETGRIKIENKNLIGSIALKGGLIDDITLKNYNSNQAANSSKVVLLNPKKLISPII